MDDMTAADLDAARKVLRRLLGHPDPAPATGLVVPNEGGNPEPPGISPAQYNLDFIKRMNGEIPAYAEQLPEPEKDR